jgi:hypothetical protein
MTAMHVRLRWWMWLVAGLLLLLTAVIVIQRAARPLHSLAPVLDLLGRYVGTTQQTREKMEAIADHDPYNTISRSIAPEIFGMEDVKKALLLQVGGGE